tara:strand:+ start:1887 stop:2798 length:912 start_codon:yes stop_codon:yes gene_type:complete
MTLDQLGQFLINRFGDVGDYDTINDFVVPFLIPNYLEIISIQDIGELTKRGSGWSILGQIRKDERLELTLARGCSGKIVPGTFVNGGGGWSELGKVRVHEDTGSTLIVEFYAGSKSRRESISVLSGISVGDYFEYDPYGVTPKMVSATAERVFELIAKDEGWNVTSMPDDKAAHLGPKEHYDFQIHRGNLTLRAEVKSLWGTDTRKCRLIHSLGRRHQTSSIRFEDQDIVAVSLFLRTGRITDFAFAASVSTTVNQYLGLPPTTNYSEHVNQNPDCVLLDGRPWFPDINSLVDAMIENGLLDS